MMEEALQNPKVALHAVDPMEGKTALHLAAECPDDNGAAAVRWLLEKGIPWNVTDGNLNFPELLARQEGNTKSFKILREWAIEKEYHLYHTTKRPEDEADHEFQKRFHQVRMDAVLEDKSKKFAVCNVEYFLPYDAPEEIAMLCKPGGHAIMMEWERPIMKKTAELLLDGMPTKGLRILNIGMGLGIIDSYFQEAHPAEHVIIEPHAMAVEFMRQTGWLAKPNVKLLHGRWQAFLEHASDELSIDVESPNAQHAEVVFDTATLKTVRRTRVDVGKFDVVYFDTYMEGYRGHYAFVKHVPRLLRGPGSRFSFFHGHGAKDRSVSEIYKEAAGRHNNDLGLNTKWSEIHVDPATQWHRIQERGKGVPYTHPHLIPICALAPTVPRTAVPGVAWNPYPSRMHHSVPD
ncbi:S-adenosyl-L-methionine-dependent methyltransferase [Phellopilus nigrolimitatus]|nr:S-adenosyl-L-methionine-dependent methyltransferase [Phellopilus nigrolimitatus]